MGLVMILLWIVDRSVANREIRFDGTGANWERMAMAWVARGIRQPEKRGPASDEVLFWKNEKREKRWKSRNTKYPWQETRSS